MLLLVGQVARGMRGREAFQEIDYGPLFGSTPKWVGQVDAAARLPELLGRACTVATLRAARARRARAAGGHARRGEPTRRTMRRPDAGSASRAPTDLERSRELLAGAERPLVVVGEAAAGARRDLRRPARVLRGERPARRRLVPLPGLRRQPLARRTSATSASAPIRGSPSACATADVLLAVGGRLGEMTTAGYTLLEVPRPHAARSSTCIPSPEELGRVYEPGARRSSRRCRPSRPRARALAPVDSSAWRGAAAAGARRLRSQPRHGPMPGELDLARGDGDAPRSAAGGRDPHQRRRATSRSGPIASTSSAATGRSSRRRAAPWATACRRRVAAEAAASRPRRSSASPATATSS